MPKRSTRKPSFAVRSCVLCDEIRTEDNGKFLLIGVYSGQIVVQEFPTMMAFTAYLEIELPTGEHQTDIRLKYNGDVQSGMNGTLVTLSAERLGINTARLPVRIDQPGYLELEVQFDNSAWVVATKKKVVQASTESASEPGIQGEGRPQQRTANSEV